MGEYQDKDADSSESWETEVKLEGRTDSNVQSYRAAGCSGRFAGGAWQELPFYGTNTGEVL
jgi:hypothetical protein